MSNINSILLLELNKAEQMLADRKISAKNNLGKLVKSGAVRGFTRMTKGIEVGTQHLLNNKKYGSHYKLKTPFNSNKIVTNIEKKEISAPKFNKKSLDTSISRRHEADETKSIEMTKKYHNNENPSGIYFKKNNKIVGYHDSPQVLKNEKKLVDYGSLFDKNTKYGREYRINTGEYGPNGSDMKSKKITKLRKSNPTINEIKNRNLENENSLKNNNQYQHLLSRQKLADNLFTQHKKVSFFFHKQHYDNKLNTLKNKLQKPKIEPTIIHLDK